MYRSNVTNVLGHNIEDGNRHSVSYAFQYEQFASDIGGTMGLWTGFCVFTGVELVDLILQSIVFWIYHKPKEVITRRSSMRRSTRSNSQPPSVPNIENTEEESNERTDGPEIP